MKTVNLILIIFTSTFFSCEQSPCDIDNYTNAKWETLDNSTSFVMCAHSAIHLATTDSIQIEYLGLLNKENKLTHSSLDKSILTLISNIRFGTFLVRETSLDTTIKTLISKMKRHSECIVKYQFADSSSKFSSTILTVYFQNYVKGNKIKDWIAKIRSNSYVDSILYVSPDSAIKAFETEDTAWRQFLRTNPLPSSAAIHIKPEFYNQHFLDSLKEIFINNPIIADATYTTLDFINTQNQYLEILKNSFCIKLKT